MRNTVLLVTLAVVFLIVLSWIQNEPLRPGPEGTVLQVNDKWLRPAAKAVVRCPRNDDGHLYAKAVFDAKKYRAEYEEPNGIDFEPVDHGVGGFIASYDGQAKTVKLHERRGTKKTIEMELVLVPLNP